MLIETSIAVHFFRRDCGSLNPTLPISGLFTFKFEAKPMGKRERERESQDMHELLCITPTHSGMSAQGHSPKGKLVKELSVCCSLCRSGVFRLMKLSM